MGWCVKSIKKALKLKPGTLVFTEFEESKSACARTFSPNHVCIYVDYPMTSIAHSVKVGGQLPGVKLTEIPNGRHQFFEYSDDILSKRFNSIARLWSQATKVYTLAQFEELYPKRFFDSDKDYERYTQSFDKGQTLRGPATPYNYARSSSELFDRARDSTLKKFNISSLRRAIQYASLSGKQVSIDGNMRCSSFVTAVVQSAVLQPYVNPMHSYCSFLERLDDKAFFNASIKSDSLKRFYLDYIDKPFSWPDGFCFDNKYVLPNDIYTQVSKSKAWTDKGRVTIDESHLVVVNDKKCAPVRVARDKQLSVFRRLNRSSQSEEQMMSYQQDSVALYMTPPSSPKKKSSKEKDENKFTPLRKAKVRTPKVVGSIDRRSKRALSMI